MCRLRLQSGLLLVIRRRGLLALPLAADPVAFLFRIFLVSSVGHHLAILINLRTLKDWGILCVLVLMETFVLLFELAKLNEAVAQAHGKTEKQRLEKIRVVNLEAINKLLNLMQNVKPNELPNMYATLGILCKMQRQIVFAQLLKVDITCCTGCLEITFVHNCTHKCLMIYDT